MTDSTPAQALYSLIGKIRRPVTLRELIAACLRSIYMGDPFTREEGTLPKVPTHLLEEVSVKEVVVSGVRCAIYSPTKKSTSSLMLYMHGGGFVVGCSEDTDYITRTLCHSNQMVVVSVNYRLAPETVFPGALNDCEAAFEFFIEQRAEFGIDATSVFLAGDSAGANLAIALYQRIQRRISSIKGIVLLAPWLDMEVEKYDSYNRLAPNGVVFDAAFIGFARGAYVGFEEWKNPLVSPLLTTIADLPPTIALIGTADPLLDQTLRLKQSALEALCNHIEVEVYPDMPHCFYSFPSLFVEEKNCFERITDFICKTR